MERLHGGRSRRDYRTHQALIPKSSIHMSIGSSALLLLFGFSLQPDAAKPFRINVIDDATGRGVPLVELRTVNGIIHHTDSAGIVAFHEPGLMGKDVFFHVASHGYEFAKDGFGYRGKALHVKAGGEATLKIRRVNIAERLYRVTGGGIYRDSVLVGAKTPIREPVLNGLGFGSDSVVNAGSNGKIHWCLGGPNKPSYPLGNFQVPGATSPLPRGAKVGALFSPRPWCSGGEGPLFSPLPLYSGGEGLGV